MEDIRIMIGDVKFGSRAVAVIEKNNKILFQKRKKDDFWALPGGAIATLERGKDVVVREIAEETGEANAKVIRPLWFVEYLFSFDGKKQHQYILGFLTDIPDDSILLEKDEFDGIEEGKEIIYKWFDVATLADQPIKPDYLKDKLLNIKDEFEFVEAEEL